MVIEIDTQHDTPEEVADKIKSVQSEIAANLAEKRKASKLAAFGKVQWDEDSLTYQKRLRDEWG